jgi:ankyrin repeat protein
LAASNAGLIKLFLAHKGLLVNSRDSSGCTALSRAAWEGDTAIVKLLLMREDIKVDAEDENGSTPLSRAIRRNHKDVVALLKAALVSRRRNGGFTLTHRVHKW